MDPYLLHRLALKPLLSPSPREEFKTIADKIHEIGEDRFLKFLASNMLTPLWHETLAKHDATSFFSNDFTVKLIKASLIATGRYLKQQHSLNKVTEILNTESIPYAVYKGARIREIIYSNPTVRAADDIDILVSKTDKEKALQALVKAGYELHLSVENISHEALLSDQNAKIDLHWDILRPGRTRIDLTDEILSNKQPSTNNNLLTTNNKQLLTNYYALNNEAELFIMLIHPAITKYLTAPHASIVRVVDLIKWIQTQEIDWELVYTWLDKAGLKTTAWTTAYWLELLTGKTLPTPFIERISPTALKGSYLQNWINKNYSTKFLDNPLLIKAGFTLPIHDSLSDALHAVRSLQREKKIAQAETNKLKSVVFQ
jgi:hypothetical protein